MSFMAKSLTSTTTESENHKGAKDNFASYRWEEASLYTTLLVVRVIKKRRGVSNSTLAEICDVEDATISRALNNSLRERKSTFENEDKRYCAAISSFVMIMRLLDACALETDTLKKILTKLKESLAFDAGCGKFVLLKDGRPETNRFGIVLYATKKKEEERVLETFYNLGLEYLLRDPPKAQSDK